MTRMVELRHDTLVFILVTGGVSLWLNIVLLGGILVWVTR